MLKYRIMTALVLIPLLVWGIFSLPPSYFAFMIAAVMGLSAWEWAGLMGFTMAYRRVIYVLIILLGIYFVRPVPIFYMLLLGLFVWLWALAAIVQFQRGKNPMGFQCPEVQAIVGFVVLVVCWLAFINLRLGAGQFGATRLLLGLAIIFSADTGAYFAGRLWGKHALVSKVSPKKTWEGLVGGLLSALIVTAIPSFYFPMSTHQRILLWVLALLVALFSVVGDLTVSLLKRQSGVKDSGQLLPGHGGLLDRVDSIAAGILVFALGLVLLGV